MSNNGRQKNRIGPYRVLKRLRNASTQEGAVGRVYTALQAATGRPALLVTPAAPGHYVPPEEYRLRVRAGTLPSPYVALEVERAPQGASPLGVLEEGLDAVASMLEGVERHPEAMAHLCAPAVRRRKLRSWHWLAVAAGLALAALAPRAWRAAQPPPEEPAQPALAAVAEEALAEPEPLPLDAMDARAMRILGADLPGRPFKNQRKAPCEEGAEVEIRLRDGSRTCWVGVKYSQAVCRTRGYEWQGECFLPSIPSPRDPSSTLPTHPLPAHQRAD